LRKDPFNKMVFGVCSGLANEYQLDPTIVRLGFVVTTALGFGLPVIIYIALAVIMPE
jgi:phage shock protein C